MNERLGLNSHRRIFVVDIENVIGSGAITENDVLRVKDSLEGLYSICSQDLVVIGVSHSKNVFSAHAWTSSRIVLKRGHDGADLALKKVLRDESVANRFREVVIVSGDGIFSEEAGLLRGTGLRVTIHAEIRRVATRLLRFASFANLTYENKVAVQLELAA